MASLRLMTEPLLKRIVSFTDELHDTFPLPFIAQINLSNQRFMTDVIAASKVYSELGADDEMYDQIYESDVALPSSGLLSIFYDAVTTPYGYFASDASACKVRASRLLRLLLSRRCDRDASEAQRRGPRRLSPHLLWRREEP